VTDPRRWLLPFVLLAALLVAMPEARAQSANGAEPGAAARALADILRDDAARESLIAQLLEGAEAAGVAPAATPEPILHVSAAREIAEFTRSLGEATAGFLSDLARSSGAILGLLTGATPIDWDTLRAAAAALALVIAVTLGLSLVLRALGRAIARRLADAAVRQGWLRALLRLVAYSLIDALVILLAWAGGYAVALATGTAASMDIRQSLFLNAFLLVEMTKVVLRIGLVPRHGSLRFLPMTDETAAYWYFWASRVIGLIGYGMLLVVPLVADTVSPVVGASLGTLIALTALLTAVLIVLQNRAVVRAALRARHEADGSDMTGRLLAWLGVVWHGVAILWLVALFVIWQASPETALPFMLAATAQSALAIGLGVLAAVLIGRAIAGGMRLPEDVKRALPLLESRLNAFVPTILQVVRALVALAVLASIGQAWDVVDFLGWLASEAGTDLVSRLISAAVVVLVAGLAWLAVSSFVEYRLNPSVGRPPGPRERTLLSLFRNAITVVLVVIAIMLALAQLGMNIAPLLAGAGVIGLASGFGAQRLVQDVITGAFIQIENAMNEGDVVTAGGTTGVVEKLTIRSVGLRDLSGAYHLIPFSSVGTVTNFMKGFGYHVANIGVAYREDIDEVKRLMQLAFERLKETHHAPDIIGDFEMHGVTELGDSSVVIRGRIRTRPGSQWALGRTYTELVKKVLDEHGVEIPFPHMTLYMGEDKDGSAPPLRIQRAVEARLRASREGAGDGSAGTVPAQRDTLAGDSGPAPGAAPSLPPPGADSPPRR
jgi:moderate conductance mechanosensitive channel